MLRRAGAGAESGPHRQLLAWASTVLSPGGLGCDRVGQVLGLCQAARGVDAVPLGPPLDGCLGLGGCR